MNFLLKLKIFILDHPVTFKQPLKIVQILLGHPVLESSENPIYKLWHQETEKGTTSHLLEVIEVLNENVKNLKSEMKQLAAENQATGKLLRALADQNSIYLDDLDSWLIFI